jgi:hypothetical protein
VRPHFGSVQHAVGRERGRGSRAAVTPDDVLAHVARALSRPAEKTSALRFAETVAAMVETGPDLAAAEKRKAQLAHARRIEAAEARAHALRPPPAGIALKIAERVHERAVERRATHVFRITAAPDIPRPRL